MNFRLHATYALLSAVLAGTLMLSGSAEAAVSCVYLTHDMSYSTTDAQVGGEVTKLQLFLQKDSISGSDPRATGLYDTATQLAVASWQKSHGVASSGSGYGSVGPKTRAAMALCKSVQASVAKTAVPVVQKVVATSVVKAATTLVPVVTPTLVDARRVLKAGMTGSDVLDLQKRLVSLGFLESDSATGYFGPQTTRAVRLFQTKTNLPATGTGDVKTIVAVASAVLNIQQTVALATTTSPAPVLFSAVTQTAATSSTQNPIGATPTFLGPIIVEQAYTTSCLQNGVVVQNGKSETFYSQTYVPFGTSCTSVAQARSCTNGTLGGSNAYPYKSCVALPAPSACFLGGATLNSGQSALFYAQATVPQGSSCISGSRTCSNATMLGDTTYKYSSCNVAAPSSCTMGGVTIQSGDTRTFFNVQSALAGDSCDAHAQSRSCQNGGLSGGPSYQYASCTTAVPVPQACSFNGQPVASGSSVIAFERSSVPSGQSCSSQVRACSNGTLSGSFAYGSCSVGAPQSCTFNGTTIQSGGTVTAYNQSSVGFGMTCPAEVRTCTNGVLSGSYSIASCTVTGAQSCSFAGTLLPSGGSVTAYAQSSVPFGQSCSAETRACTNGSLSGSYTNAACSVAAPASCTFAGAPVANGGTVTAYAQSSVPSGQSCISEIRSCSNGSLSGSYTNAACTVTAPQPIINGYASSQVAPAAAANLSMGDLETIFNERGSRTPYYAANQVVIGGVTADVIKIIQTPSGSRYPYLAVYHHLVGGDRFGSYLAYSNDLKSWQGIGMIDDYSGMPDVRILPDNSVVFAQERNPSKNRPYVQVRYYRTLSGFISNPTSPTSSFDIPGSGGASADGTPEIGRITYGGDINQSSIEISYHYFLNSQVDKQAKGTLTNFASWTAVTDSGTNSALESRGYPDIGKREYFQVGATVYELVEADVTTPYTANWDTWRTFLINKNTGEVRQLAPNIAGGAYSVGAPTASFLTLPDGTPAVAFAYFLFSQGAAQTPSGPHMYIYPLTGDAPPPQPLTYSYGATNLRGGEGVVVPGDSYNYDPSVILDNGVYRAYWCGSYSGHPGDNILYAESTSLSGPWHSHYSGAANTYDSVFHASNSAYFDGVHTCDPSVMKVNGTYYMYYTGADNPGADGPNAIGVASSADGISWTRMNGGLPILGTSLYVNRGLIYGAGQQSVTYANGKYYLIYGDTTGTASLSNGAGQYLIRADNPLFTQNAEIFTGSGWVPHTASTVTSHIWFNGINDDIQYIDGWNDFLVATHSTLGEEHLLLFDSNFAQIADVVVPSTSWVDGPGLVSTADSRHAIMTSSGNVAVDILRGVGTCAANNCSSKLGWRGADLVRVQSVSQAPSTWSNNMANVLSAFQTVFQDVGTKILLIFGL